MGDDVQHWIGFVGCSSLKLHSNSVLLGDFMRIARRSSGLVARLRSARQPRAAVPTLLVIILLSTFVFAADLTGRWKGPMQSDGDAVFDLKSDKGAISGT